ncbi:copper resistance CopC family protein [Streptomyces sp. URMC 128]|uniref:copper resistance CopC family protein n=1 Tax=Streptomyces sp. URMC 128 TaxID=3423404 RepID=UPI003F19D68A
MAQAHAVLLFAAPAIEGAVATAPISLVFDEPVQPSGAKWLTVKAGDGRSVSLGRAERGAGGEQLTAPVRTSMRAGVYAVTWQAVAADGDVMSGGYRFAVGSAVAGLTGTSGAVGQQQTSGATATAVLRWVLFGSFALAVGGLVGERLVARRREPEHGAASRSWTLPGTVAGSVAALGLAVLVAGGGSLGEGLTSPS